MRIAIMSDSHNNWPACAKASAGKQELEEAVKLANDRDCSVLLSTGDLIAPPGIPILEKFNGEV